MNQKLITLSFAAWILFLTLLFLLGKLENEKNIHHSPESSISQALALQKQNQFRMESRMESQWSGISRVWAQLYKLTGSMLNMIRPSAFISHKALSFEEEIVPKAPKASKHTMKMPIALWEVLGTSIPAMEE